MKKKLNQWLYKELSKTYQKLKPLKKKVSSKIGLLVAKLGPNAMLKIKNIVNDKLNIGNNWYITKTKRGENKVLNQKKLGKKLDRNNNYKWGKKLKRNDIEDTRQEGRKDVLNMRICEVLKGCLFQLPASRPSLLWAGVWGWRWLWSRRSP